MTSTGATESPAPETVRANRRKKAVARALSKSLLGAARPSPVLWPSQADPVRRIRLFGIVIENTRLDAAARELAQAAQTRRRLRAVFANAHVVNVVHDDPDYRACVTRADRVFADGSGMALAARICGKPLVDNVNGTDLLPVLCQHAVAAGIKIFLLGGKPGIAAAAATNLAEFGLGDAIAGTHHGYFARGTDEEDRVIGEINASGAHIVLVGFGVPIQDTWIERNAARLDAPVTAGVGGLFDFFSGAVSRSPKLMRSLGCEWVWRLAMEPRRMAYRYLVGNVLFVAHALRDARRARSSSEIAAMAPVRIATLKRP